jgi:hypothetical protein
MHSKKLIDEVSIVERTVAEINGRPVAASGIYEDEEGEPLVDLRVDKRLYEEQMIGDRIPIGEETWELVALVASKGKGQKGTVVLRRE